MGLSSNLQTSSEQLGVLSSGTEIDGVHYDTVFSYLFDLLGTAGDWAGAVSDLIGLVA